MSERNKAAFPLFFPPLFSPPACAVCRGRWGLGAAAPEHPRVLDLGWGITGVTPPAFGGPSRRSGVSSPRITQGQIKRVHSQGVKQVWGPSLGCGMHPAGTDVSPRLCQEQGGGDSPRGGDSSPAGLCHTSAPPGAPTGLSSPAGSCHGRAAPGAREKRRVHPCLTLFGFHFVTRSSN